MPRAAAAIIAFAVLSAIGVAAQPVHPTAGRPISASAATYCLAPSTDLKTPATPVAAASSADRVGMWMDGELVPDDWAPQDSKASTVRVGGEGKCKTPYDELRGFAERRFDIQRC
jgi:hypothetical protein